MFTISEQELQDLIDKHNGNISSKERTPAYDLKTIVEHGLLFIYAKNHLKDGKVVECASSLDIYKKHKCSADGSKLKKSLKSKFLEVFNANPLLEARDTLKTCWTGYNLAILTSDYILQGYFKQEMLFQRAFPQASAVVATTDKICVGLFTGDIIYFDPISQNEITKKCHNDIVTSMRYENGHLLSGSLDGSIFYKKKMQISTTGILEACFITENKFVCSCLDNVIALYDAGEVKSYIGHKDRIKTLSYNGFAISTSKDGTVGFLVKDSEFKTRSLGCSMHKRRNINQFFGYGLSEVFLYDVNQFEETWKLGDKSLNLDIKDELVVYSHDKGLRLADIRMKESMDIPLNMQVTDVSFSQTGDMLLVCTEQNPLVFELRRI
ncbi:hypothetical protein GINT2_002306 [Glugoides intestinalis]